MGGIRTVDTGRERGFSMASGLAYCIDVTAIGYTPRVSEDLYLDADRRVEPFGREGHVSLVYKPLFPALADELWA